MSHYLNKQVVKETYRGRVDRVEALLSKGAAINKLGSDEFTPLMRAAQAGHYDLVKVLLQHGADPNATAKDGASALFWACVHEHEPVAILLLDAGADVNASRDGDYSVLNAAISKGSLTLIETLVRAGASLENRFFGEKQMYQYAEWCGRNDLAPLLKPKGRRRTRHIT